MKATICAALLLAACACQAQYRTWEMRERQQAGQNYIKAVQAAQKQLQAQAKAQTNAQAAAAAQAEKDRLANLPPVDPWRVMDGVEVAAGGAGWFRFWGKVQNATDEGLLINGSYGNGKQTNQGNFVLIRFPQTRAAGDTFAYEKSWWAKDDGTTTFGGATYHRLDYGEVRPLTDQEKAARTKALDDKRAELMATTIAYYQKRAEDGDSDAQLRLGEIYRDGEGVPKDPAKARDYLAKAAAQGNKDARKALDRLP
jgi:TPR repeat protein